MDELLKKAQAGDRGAFDQLMALRRPRLFNYLYRLLGDGRDAEDLCQESILHTFLHLQELTLDTSLDVFLFRLATELARRFLGEAPPWSPSALDILKEQLMDQTTLEQELFSIYQDFEEDYQIIDHVDFCMTVMGKGLYREEWEALVLSEFSEFDLAEIGTVLNQPREKWEKISEGARDHLGDALLQRCRLVNPAGPCTQCYDLGEWLLGNEVVEKQIKTFPLKPSKDSERSFDERLALLQGRGPDGSSSKRFHQSLLQILRHALGETGKIKD